MKNVKKVIALIMALILLTGAFTTSMTAGALSMGSLFGNTDTDETETTEEESKPSIFQDLFEQIKLFVLSLLEKFLGVTGPTGDSSFAAREWPEEERLAPASKTYVQEYVDAVNNAKNATRDVYIQYAVGTSYSIGKTNTQYTAKLVADIICDDVFVSYTSGNYDTRKQEINISDYIEPISTEALLDESNVKSVSCVINSDYSKTYTIVLYGESYTETPAVLSGVTGNFKTAEDFSLGYSETQKFAAHTQDVTVEATVSRDGLLTSQTVRIPAYYDLEATYTSKFFVGTSCFEADTLSNVYVSLHWK